MSVNNKMIAVLKKIKFMSHHRHIHLRRMAAQAVIDASWTDFDADDESTWPKQNGRYAVILNGEFDVDDWNGAWCFRFDGALPTRYALPADLMKQDKG